MSYNQDFTYVEGTEPHRIRTREIIAAHPEVKQLIGKNPATALIIAACVLFQVAVAYLLRDQSWWLVIALAWFMIAWSAGMRPWQIALLVVAAEPTPVLILCRISPVITSSTYR